MDSLDALAGAQTRLARRAIDDLATTLARLEAGLSGEALRDAVLEVFPALAERYGQASAQVALTWYERARGGLADGFEATLASVDRASLNRQARWSAGDIFTDNGDLKGKLSRVLELHVKQAGRDTISQNATRDKRAGRFARVAVGETCAFCRLMASRGFVYASARTAGELNAYHPFCDCYIVPEFAVNKARRREIEERAEAWDAEYRQARKTADGTSVNDILAEMRAKNNEF